MRSKRILIWGGCLTASVALLACDKVPTMSVASPAVAVGEEIVVSFDAPISGKAANVHWITLLSVDDPDSRSTGRVVVDHGQTSARVRTTRAGTMEVRLHNQYPQKESHLVARAPVRVIGPVTVDIPPAAAPPLSENECLDHWLAEQKLDAYGSREGSVYGNVSPLLDKSSDQMTPRTTYLYAKLPEAKVACASPAAQPVL